MSRWSGGKRGERLDQGKWSTLGGNRDVGWLREAGGES